MTMKNIVLGLLCCSIVTTGFFLTACKPSENGTGVIIHEDGTTSRMEGPGDTSKLASYQDVGLSIRAMAPSAVSTEQIAGGSDSGDQTAVSEGKPLEFEGLPNAWNGAAFDRPAYQQVFVKKYGEQNETPQTVTDGSVICLDFGEYQPKEITVRQDFSRYTAIQQETEPEVLEVPLSNNSFSVTYDGSSETVYDIQCSWSNGNSVEYALIMQPER